MLKPSSPCRGLCAIDDAGGLCRGCGRSLVEIAAWGGLTEAERLRTMALLPGRLAAFRRRGGAGEPGVAARGAAPLDAGAAGP